MTARPDWNKPIAVEVAQAALNDYWDLPEFGCHISMYKRNKTNGYAYIKGHLAHRAAWTAANGPIPPDMVVDHRCFTRMCVNPEHLRLMTRSQNAQRQSGADFPLGQCRWGHSLDNMRSVRRGKNGTERLMCWACVTERNRTNSQIASALLQLEIAYGLGGHENKRTYASMMRARAARVAAVFGEMEKAA